MVKSLSMEQSISQIKKSITQSIFSYGSWQDALRNIAKSHNSDHVHLLLYNKNKIIDGIVASNVYSDRDSITAHLEYTDYETIDERIPRFLKSPFGIIKNNQSFYKEKEIKTSPVYHEFLKKHGAQNQAIMRLNGPDGTDILYHVIRPKNKGEYNSSALDNISSFAPFIQNTLSAQYELKQVEITNISLFGLLDQKKIGIIYLNDNTQIIEANDYAQAILNRTDGLIDQNGYLSTIFADDKKKLIRQLNIILAGDFEHTNTGTQLFISRLNDKKPYKVTITPILSQTQHIGNKFPAVMLIIKSPQSSTDFAKALFKERYGLTNSELLLTEAIFNDASLNEYAISRKVKISTVRWTLDNIFEKTNTHSQKELKSLALLYSG